MQDYKHIHIGKHIKRIVEIKQFSLSRICKHFKCTTLEIEEMYAKKSLDADVLLKWSKLLDYNLFMFYHTHLQLYKPSAATAKLNAEIEAEDKADYMFRKNLYSPEIIDWIMEQYNNRILTTNQIIQRYNIPRTTLYRWKKKNHQAN